MSSAPSPTSAPPPSGTEQPLRRGLIGSYRGRLVGLVTILGAAMVLLAGLLIWRAYANEREATSQAMLGTVRAMALLVDQRVLAFEALLRGLITSGALDDGNLAVFHAQAAEISEGADRWVVVTDASGQQLVNTRVPFGAPLPRSPITERVRETLRARQTFISDLTNGEVAQAKVLFVTVPVFEGEEVRYTVSLVMTPAAFTAGLAVSSIAPGNVLAVIDRQGLIASRSMETERFVGQLATADVVAATAAREEKIFRSTTANGVSVLAAISPAPVSGWSVVVGAPLTQLRQSAVRLVLLSLGITLAALLGAIAVAWRLGRATILDVTALVDQTRAIGTGALPPARRLRLEETTFIAEAMRATAARLQHELQERQKTEMALRLSEQRFQLATDNEVIVLTEQDAALRYVWVYPRHPGRRNLIGCTDADLFPAQEASLLETMKRDVLQTGTSRRAELGLTVPSGTRHYDVIFTPRIDGRGEVIGIAGAAVDITVRKQAEDARRRAQLDLLKANSELEQKVAERTASLADLVRQMEEFTYSISHDLRAPIRAMTGFAEILMNDYGPHLPPEGRASLERITRNGRKMDQMVHDLLEFSRVSRENVTLVPVALEPLVADVLRESPAFQPPEAEIVIEPPLPEVLAHPPSLQQVLTNLLRNAVKFVPAGTKPHVRILAETQGERVRLSICDNGIGIPPEQQSRLFRVFERLHPRSHYEGTGIGLAIVRRAIERMGGRVGVESDGRSGSCFWVELRAPGSES